jgi:hypothetical protein
MIGFKKHLQLTPATTCVASPSLAGEGVVEHSKTGGELEIH